MERTYTLKFEKDAYNINFTKYQSSIAIGITLDNYTRYDIPQFIELTLSNVKFSKSNNTKVKTSIPLVPCSINDFHPDVRDQYDILGLKDLLCAENTTLVNADGGEFEDYWEYTEWSARLKDETVDDPTDFKKLLDQYPMKLIIYYPEVTIDQKNLTNPVKQLLQSKYFHLYYDLYKKQIFEFSKVEFQTNDLRTTDEYYSNNYLTLKEEIFDTYGLDRKTARALKNDNYKNLIRCYINSSRTSFIFQRRVGKIQEYLTTIQFFTVLLMVGQNAAVMLNNYYLRRSLMKSLIKIRNPDFFNNFIGKVENFYSNDEANYRSITGSKKNNQLEISNNNIKTENKSILLKNVDTEFKELKDNIKVNNTTNV